MRVLPVKLPVLFAGILLFISCFRAEAKILKITITKTEPYNNGRLYGDAGEYERIYGTAYGEVDPNNPLNNGIQDIQLAPRNAKRLVEYTSEFIILRPKDISKCNGILFLSLPNRGNAFPADSSLLKRGYVYLWAAWQGDVLVGNNRVLMHVPVATDHGKTIIGKVRAEYELNDPAKSLPLNSGYFNGLTHHTYETVSLDNSTAVLTKRVHEADPKIPVDHGDWAFTDCRNADFPGAPSAGMISIKGGFETNYIYELIYTAKDPLVMGLGFAAIRDIASFFKHQNKDSAGNPSPLVNDSGTNPVKAAIMQGVSQCGNFTRTFLQLGFNEDEDHKIVFEGVNDHIGTRRISLNIRFGRPGGGGSQHEDHLFPSNEPPFTWDKTYEPVSGTTGGILDKCIQTNTCPKIMQTFSSTEYWQYRASLRTTDSYSKKDIPIPPQVRIYLFNSTQHSPYGIADKVSGFNTNYNNYGPYLRNLVINLEKWVLEDKTPPQSMYPRVADNTLVNSDKQSIGWTDIPGVPFSGKVSDGPLLDFGPGYKAGLVTGVLREPPVVLAGKYYHVRVPKVDADDNELGGIRDVTLRAPLGTYTGWSLRKPGYGDGDLNALNGMFIPFKKTREERIAAKDPRLSLEERYKDHAGYVAKVTRAANDMVSEGYLLPEDAQNIIIEADKSDVLK